MLLSELKKLSERVAIPLHKTVRTILKKYNNKLPKAYTNQVTNVYLRSRKFSQHKKEL
jgi:hypothetical protein